VVDNASTDVTREFLANEQRAGRLTAILNDANAGFARACNQGAAVAQGKFVSRRLFSRAGVRGE